MYAIFPASPLNSVSSFDLYGPLGPSLGLLIGPKGRLFDLSDPFLAFF